MKSVLFFFFVTLVAPYCAAQATANSSVVEVTGTGTVYIPATLAEIELGVQITSTNASQAQAEASLIARSIIASLRSLNVSHLQTSLISLTFSNTTPLPITEYSTSKSALTFTATNELSFQTPASMAGPAIDAAVSAGANAISSIRFTASASKITSAQQQAVQLAVGNAVSYGSLLINALGCSAVEVGTVSLTSIPQAPAVSGSIFEAVSVVTPVVFGQLEFQATVSVDIYQSCPGATIRAINACNGTNCNLS